MDDFEMLDPLTETLDLDMQIASESLIPVVPALLIWDGPVDGEASFTLKIYPRHASHLEEAIDILDKLISIGVDHMRIEVDFTHSPPEHESHVVCSLAELIGDPLSIKTRLRGVSS